jgi:hypothetical protein
MDSGRRFAPRIRPALASVPLGEAAIRLRLKLVTDPKASDAGATILAA